MKRLFNFFRDHLIEYFFIALAFVGAFYLALTQGSYARVYDNFRDNPDYYANKIFDDSYVHKIEVNISDNNLQELLDSPREKNKYHTTVIIDGEKFDDVAFSVRGNGSVGAIYEDGNSNRYSYTVNFKNFNDKLNYHGLDKLVLNSLYFEASYLRTYLAFKIMAAAKVNTPLTAFTELYINNELKGTYLAIEAVDRSFLDRIGATPDAALFHPSPYDADWDRIYSDGKLLSEQQNNEAILLHRDSSKNTYGGSDLVYRGDDSSSYNAIFMNASTKYSHANEAFVIAGIESLSEVSLKNPADYWDTDAVIRYFAANAIAPNPDSYISSLAQNYYLAFSGSRLSIVPWDYDLAFMIGGFSPASSLDDPVISWSVDSPTSEVAASERPLWQLIANNPEYFDEYHKIVQSTLDEYVFSGNCRRELDNTVELMRHYVYSDPSRRYSVDEFEDEVEYLRRFILLRADSIQKQLWDI